MASNTATTAKRRTTRVPVTTLEEIPVLSAQERSALTNALEEAQARVEAGTAIDYAPETFKARLLRIYRGDKR